MSREQEDFKYQTNTLIESIYQGTFLSIADSFDSQSDSQSRLLSLS